MLRSLKYTLLICLILLVTASCRKAYFYSGINDNNTLLKDPKPALLLPGIILKSAYKWGGDASRFSSIFTQQATGYGNQTSQYSRYNVSPDDVDNYWTFGVYGAIMNDIHAMIRSANQRGNLYYSAIGKVLMANTLGLTTDAWGDVPYAEAFQGNANPQPRYDAQKAVYDTLHKLLDEAIATLSGDDNSVDQPGDDDVLFKGDISQWIRFAHSLKAKFYLHVVKVDNSALPKVLSQAKLGFMPGENAVITFLGGEAATQQAPWFQFITQRVGDVRFNGYLHDLLKTAEDPRLPAYFTESGGNTNLGPYLGSSDAPVFFMSYDELKFVEAEGQFRSNNKGEAANAYNEGVKASLKRIINDDSYAAKVAKTAADITLNDIMTQKYISLFTNPEAWTDWRRTELPVLKPFPGSVLTGQLPRSLLYPSGEQRYNSNSPKNTTMLRRVWWDVK